MSDYKTATKGSYYVDNKKFYDVLVDYRARCKEAEANNQPKPVIPDYIGECFIKIATKFSYTHNSKMSFINYPFKDEMIGDAIENCVRAVHSFDPEKSTNPFSYFTQVAYFAFIRRITKEKVQGFVKYKMIHQSPFDTMNLQDHDETGEFTNAYLDFLQSHSKFNEVAYNSFVEKRKGNKNKVKENEHPLNAFFENQEAEDELLKIAINTLSDDIEPESVEESLID